MSECARLSELLADHRGEHSEFQMSHFIVGRNNFTAYGAYKQALRELEKRVSGLDAMRGERDLLAVDIDELESSRAATDFDSRRNRINLRLKRSAAAELDRRIAACERELRHFYALAVDLKEQIGPLDDGRRAELDREHWRCRIMAQAAVELTTTGRVAAGTVELLMSTPKEWRQPILAIVRQECDAQQSGHQGPLLEWMNGQ